MAYTIFNTYKLDEKKLAELKKYASENEGAIFSFFSHFFPDEIIPELEKLDPNNKMSILQYRKLTENFEESEWWKVIKHQETHESFLDYCLYIGSSDPDYWEKIYSHLNITWDTKDEKDPIYFIIKHKDYFKFTESEAKEIGSNQEAYILAEPANKENSSFSIFIKRHKNILIYCL